MPRVALYETLVLSLCNALGGSIVAQLGPFTRDAESAAAAALSWFASMFLVWWRVALRGRMRFTWPGCVAAAIGAGLLGHVVFHLLSAGVSDWNHAQTLAKTLAIPLYLAILMMGSVITYGVQTVFFGALLGILLFVWKKKARGMPRLAAPGAVR
jgi:high-affinity Fe2+/Pb2+ permease